MRVWRVFLALSTLGILGIALALLNNNFPAHKLSREEFVRKLDHAAAASRDWVYDQTVKPHPSLIMDYTHEGGLLLANTALVHMLLDCAQLSGEERLRDFPAPYFQIMDNPEWFGRLVDPKARFERPPEEYVARLPNYLKWFLYATAPREFPLPPEERADMFAPDKYRTGRATHQLLALYLHRKFNGSTPELDGLIQHVGRRVASEASLDFRVTDLYIQRVAALLAAGLPDLVKARWVERVLDAQQSDGGWHFTWYGWHPTPYRFELEDASTNHPTVQGMWLCYMLKYRYPKWIATHY